MVSQGLNGRWWQDLALPILDSGSGLYRADLLYSRLHRETAAAPDGARPFSVLLLEGQPASGQRLKAASVRAAASALFSTARQEDMPARLGPRLFALLLPGLDEGDAARIGRVIALDLHLAAAATGDRWHVSCLGFPAQRERLESLTARHGVRRRSHARVRRRHAA